ncbi:MAG: SH3 domain-containing protein [Bdellovibrionaceae bacterium]|nr:SH3 domain-containing protein [Pseudobdellovibrionaceae bacterium]
MSLLRILPLGVLLSFQASASHFEKGAPLFYKSPHSQFPSGQLSEDELESKKIRTEETNTYQVTWDKRDFFFESHEMAKDIHASDLITSNRSFSVIESREGKAKESFYLSKNDVVRLTAILSEDWLEVENLKTNKRGVARSSDFSSFSEDPGLAFSYMATFLRDSPSDSSRVITTIPQNTRLKISEWKDHKIRVQFNGHTGFIDSGHVILKADFASWVLHSKHGWTEVKYREGPHVRTKQNELLTIADVKAYVTDKKRGFSLVHRENGPKLKSKLEIVDLEPNRWVVSRLAEHGDIWWKKLRPTSTHVQTKSLGELTATGIYSSDIATDTPTRGLVSAKGIYRSDDGIMWSKIDFFKDENWPVVVTKNVWYVGSFRSLDEGKTFEPFIRWDYLSYLMSVELQSNPKFFKILRMESMGPKEIKIQMDLGVRKVVLSYNSYLTTWKILPEWDYTPSKKPSTAYTKL